ncbi:MAG: hypothetical protein Q4F41_19720, partial [Eubacteriales bacterium]|nr:hypothetical protein [Eubacteriales bacterium]
LGRFPLRPARPPGTHASALSTVIRENKKTSHLSMPGFRNPHPKYLERDRSALLYELCGF